MREGAAAGKANPDLQTTNGLTALMSAADYGHEACVKPLLRAKANTELLTKGGHNALQRAEIMGHGHRSLIRQHAAPQQPATAAPAASRTLASLR